MAVCHTKALLEDGAITVGVNLEFHGHGDIIIHLCLLEWLIGDNFLATSHESCRVLRCLDRRAWVPAELVAERVVSLVSDGNTTTVALIADNFMTSSLGLMNYFHGSENINAWVKAAFVQDYHALCFGLGVKCKHFW